MKKSNKRSCDEWVEVCGVMVPKYQLEEAEKEMEEKMEEDQRTFRQMKRDVRDPEKYIDPDKLLEWAEVFKVTGDTELAEIALKRSRA